MKILTVMGTRPEAIKLAPLAKRLSETPGIDSRVCVTAQHRQMLDQVLAIFGLVPDHDLDLMRHDQGLPWLTGAVLAALDPVLADHAPDWVVVQGDTTTTFAAALAAFYRHVPVAHVEAGLRTGNVRSPWPEEMNRRLASGLASLHFAPTEGARDNLLRENVDGSRIVVTGNTVIDALLAVRDRIAADHGLRAELSAEFGFLDPNRRLVLVTGHRRENFDGGLERVFGALLRLAGRGDVEVLYPVHLNPNVQAAANRVLTGRSGVHLIAPVDYLRFVHLMGRADLIVTDSGGVQEEAPSLGKPVLVTRDTTERPEAIEAGTARLVGTDEDDLVRQAGELLDDPDAYARMSRAVNPYGDGRAVERIIERLVRAQLH